MKSPSIHVTKNEKKEEQKRKMPFDCRNKAMKTWAKAKKNEDTDSEEVSEKEVGIKRRKRRGIADALNIFGRKSREREGQSRKNKNLL